jgi:hypothetical protein
VDKKSNLFTKSCTFKRGSWNCGSYQFNLQKNHIDQGDLCDVHYWQTQAQRPWVGLTDEEAQQTFARHNCTISTHLAGILARAIEAKLREKNT